MTNPDDDHLAALLAALRAAQADDTAPVHVEAALMRAWDASHVPHASHGRLPALSQFAGLAAGAVLAVGLTALGGHLRTVTSVTPSTATEASPTVILVGEPILDGEQVRLVRVRMPAAVLLTLGVRSTAAPAEGIDVDVVVGEDGVARALSLNP